MCSAVGVERELRGARRGMGTACGESIERRGKDRERKKESKQEKKRERRRCGMGVIFQVLIGT